MTDMSIHVNTAEYADIKFSVLRLVYTILNLKEIINNDLEPYKDFLFDDLKQLMFLVGITDTDTLEKQLKTVEGWSL